MCKCFIVPQSTIEGGEMHCPKREDQCESVLCKAGTSTQMVRNLGNTQLLLHSDICCTAFPYKCGITGSNILLLYT